MSQVFVFNTLITSLELILNQQSPKALGAASPDRSWSPPSFAFPRGPGGFDTQNQLLVTASSNPTPQSYAIDTSAFLPQSDLQLYLFGSHAVLTAGWSEQILTAQSFGGGGALAAEDAAPTKASPDY